MSFVIDALSGPNEFWASFWLYFLLGVSGCVFMVAILPVFLILSLAWMLIWYILCGALAVMRRTAAQSMRLFSRMCRCCGLVVECPNPAFDDVSLVRRQRDHRCGGRHHQDRRPRYLSYDSAAVQRWGSNISSLTVRTGTHRSAERVEGAERIRNGAIQGVGTPLQPLLFGCQRILFYNYGSVTPDTSIQTIYGGSEESSGDRAYLDAREELGSSSSLSSWEMFSGAEY